MIPGLIQGVVDSAEEAQFASAHFIVCADVSRNVESVLAFADADYAPAPYLRYRINRSQCLASKASYSDWLPFLGHASQSIPPKVLK